MFTCKELTFSLYEIVGSIPRKTLNLRKTKTIAWKSLFLQLKENVQKIVISPDCRTAYTVKQVIQDKRIYEQKNQ